MRSKTLVSTLAGLALFALPGFAGNPAPSDDPVDIPTPEVIQWAVVEGLDASGAAVAGPGQAIHEIRVTLSGERAITTRTLRSRGRLYQVSLGDHFCLVSPQPAGTQGNALATSVTVTHPLGLTVVSTLGIHSPPGWAATWDKKPDPQTMQCTIDDPGGFCVYVPPGGEVPQVNAALPGSDDGTSGAIDPSAEPPNPFDPRNLPDCPTEPFSPPCYLQCPGPCCPGMEECPGPCCPCSGPGCPDYPQGQ
jgi:hypothetical protein